jgi:hypothetical protein
VSDDFQTAAERARQRYGALWDELPGRDKVTAIYEELRKLDIERTKQPPPPQKDTFTPVAN